MAISVDTVYKTVLLILNSEQRGYMTPDEFNKIGTQVQREIFERYFEDLNQQLRIPQSDMDYSNRVAITDEKIAEFKTESDAISTGTNTFTLPSDLYRLGSLTYERPGFMPVEVQRVGRAEFYNIRKSPLTTPTNSKPIYLYEDNKVEVYPSTIISDIKSQYVKKPNNVRWGYEIGDLGQYLYTEYKYNPSDLVTDSVVTIKQNVVNGSTYSSSEISQDNTSGDGIGATFLFQLDSASGDVTNALISGIGSGYKNGDTISFDSSNFGTTGQSLILELSDINFMSSTTKGRVDFDLHNSEQVEVILNVLFYAGVVIRDPNIIQTATQKIQQEEVNEKS